MNPMLSGRANTLQASPIRKLMPLADAAKARGVLVHHLNIGQPDLPTPEAMRQRLREIKETVLEYSPSQGTPAFLRSLFTYYERIGIKLEPGQIMATTGGSEAILFAMMSCAAPGDDVMVVEPFYTNYHTFATMAGLRLIPVVSKGEDGFHLPPREVWEGLRSPRTRIVLLNNPSNPTGAVYRQEELRMIADFCRDHGLFLVSDEVYREFVYDGKKAQSVLTLEGLDEHVVVVDSLSKRYSACGIRLGNIATRNRDVYEACLKMGQGRLSPPGLAQAIASGATQLDSSYFEGVKEEYQRRRKVLYEGLTRIPGVFLRRPEGAFYVVARLPVEDTEDFAAWLLRDFDYQGKTVMVAPAAGFYVTPGLGNNEVRIAYVLKEDKLHESVEVLRAGLETYCKIKGLDQRVLY